MTEKMLKDIEKLQDIKQYELAVTTKNHIEERRDEINKYYTSLFTAIISIMPFINQITGDGKICSNYSVRLLLVLLSLVSITLSISWVLTLKHIYNYTDGLNKFLVSLEEKYDKAFFSFVFTYLDQIHSPDRVTKQGMLIPYTFIVTFLLTLGYSIKLLIDMS